LESANVCPQNIFFLFSEITKRKKKINDVENKKTFEPKKFFSFLSKLKKGQNI